MTGCDCSVFSEKGLLSQKHRHFEYRHSQFEMCRHVAGAFEKEHHLVVEAGTGTGKTLAYLVPAAWLKKRVVVSTGTKNLQDQLFYKDVPFLQEELKKKVRACCMKGRGNYLCRLRFDTFAGSPLFESLADRDHFRNVQSWSGSTLAGDRSEIHGLPDDWPLWHAFSCRTENCIGQKCPLLEKCFLTRMKREAVRSDLIIANHYLLMADLSLKNSSYGEVLPFYDYLILDEAHLVEEIATRYFGYAVSNYRVDELLRDIRRDLSGTGDLDREWIERLDICKNESERFFALFTAQPQVCRLTAETFPPGVPGMFEALKKCLKMIGAALEEMAKEKEIFSALERRSGEISAELDLILQARHPEEYVYWCERRKRGVFLKATPIQVHPYLKTLLFEANRAVILTSATLAIDGRCEYIKKQLGMDECRELILPPEFDFQRQCLLYIPEKMPDPRSRDFLFAAAGEILKILEASHGRAFVLFTSFANLNGALDLVRPELSFPVLVQGERPKSEILEEFRKETHSVLFATTSFWQGVDVQGESLSCVVIDKLPFAVPTDPLTQGKMENIERDGGNPFLEYQVPGAVIMLKQGLGRLIRKQNDRGVLALLDRRILDRYYGRIFFRSLPPYQITHNMEIVRRFFKKEEPAPGKSGS